MPAALFALTPPFLPSLFPPPLRRPRELVRLDMLVLQEVRATRALLAGVLAPGGASPEVHR
ncbi:hypothetical protein [Streptomyces sp. PSKA30]|uniref:hypothetical protein n=1 Tax=Streptomyces sp. PSKA30 TaxID=2874597 RepID=UPI001CD15CAB|nr:hypothetical protein [Streptomyces sp. PSKA30]MBZ9638770.1 hypothetical protein [Streptomyces sp. PSKA30]